MNVLEVGFRIKQAIGLTGYNVKEFCEKTNRSRVTTALWISGRGGIIKNSSLNELCYDLNTCHVLCSTPWLISEEGSPPTLLSKQQIKKQEDNQQTNKHLQYNLKELESIISQFNQKKYNDHKDSKFYLITAEVKLDKLPKSKTELFYIATDDDVIWGTYEGYCKNSNHIVVTTFDNKLKSIDKSKVTYAGNIVMLLDRNNKG